MRVTHLKIQGFRRLKDFSLNLDEKLTIIVGDNDTGKSSILEALALVLTRQYAGSAIDYAIDPYLFNTDNVATYFEAQRTGKESPPPAILIEAVLQDDGTPALAKLKGTNNSRALDCAGICLRIEVDSDHVELLKEYAREESNPIILPVEFYKSTWRSFANANITIRDLPFRCKTVDTSLPRIHRGPNRYVSQLISDVLSDAQRRELSLAYRKLRHDFSKEAGVSHINKHLETVGGDSASKRLSVQVDMSARSRWDSSVTAHLDDLPLDCAGKGQQCRVQVRLAIADDGISRLLLLEEPENHLSHSQLNVLLDEVSVACNDRQVVVTTHSAFVLNKLGLDKLRLISDSETISQLSDLTPTTREYFQKLPGYDTLRLVLSKSCILVEGPSDELVVKSAYIQHRGKLPLSNGVDVIAISSLAFTRFLEIADLLRLRVCVVTDNDGDIPKLKRKYRRYLDAPHPSIRICYDDDEAYPTLEPQLLKANSRESLNSVLGKEFDDDSTLLDYMKKHKTKCALKLFDTASSWTAPRYIQHAIQ